MFFADAPGLVFFEELAVEAAQFAGVVVDLKYGFFTHG